MTREGVSAPVTVHTGGAPTTLSAHDGQTIDGTRSGTVRIWHGRHSPMQTYRVTASFYVDAPHSDAAERLVTQELGSMPVQRLIGDTIGVAEVHPGKARRYTPRRTHSPIAAARMAAGEAHDAHEQTATDYAVHLSRLAALLVRAQIPTAAVLVFDKDEETVSAATTIRIVSVRDPDHRDLGKLEPSAAEEVCWLIRTAYDTCEGFFPTASQKTYDTETANDEWQDHNLLELHIGEVLGRQA